MLVTRTCRHCAEEFTTDSSSRAAYCTARHRLAAFRTRRRAERAATADALRAGLGGDAVALASGLSDALVLLDRPTE